MLNVLLHFYFFFFILFYYLAGGGNSKAKWTPFTQRFMPPQPPKPTENSIYLNAIQKTTCKELTKLSAASSGFE